jgi:hypothetical protein
MAQIAGTSATPLRGVDGQLNVSLPPTGAQAAVGIGQGFAVPGDNAGRDYTWDLIITGTAPATLEVDLEESLDQAFTIATQQPGVAAAAQMDTFAGVASTTRHVSNKQTVFVRLNIITLTGGDGTTRIQGRIYFQKRGSGL